MTPTSIKTGMGFDARATTVIVADNATTSIAAADSNRVAVSVAVATVLFGGSTESVVIGPKVAGALVPLTCLTSGHPACYLSVDKLGSLVMLELFALNQAGTDVSLGVSTIRQVQQLP